MTTSLSHSREAFTPPHAGVTLGSIITLSLVDISVFFNPKKAGKVLHQLVFMLNLPTH